MHVVSRMAVCLAVFFSFAGAASALTTAHRAVDPMVDVEVALARTCGMQCVALLHKQSALLQSTGNGSASGSHGLLEAVAAEAGDRLQQAVALAAAQSTPQPAKAEASSSSSMSGVPCSSPAACAMKSLGANRCNYARVALQQAYNELNVATHALGELVSSLCGCLRSGQVVTCALRGVPAACAFPYTVYSKAFAGSVQVWEAVKASTSTCILHGDSGLLQ